MEKRKRPVFHIQHVNKENAQSMFYERAETVNFKEEVQPLLGEVVIQKFVNSVHWDKFRRTIKKEQM